MTLVAKIDGVTLPDGALVIGGSPNSSLPGGINGLPAAAWYCEALQGGITLDDPAGDLDSVVTLEGLHTFTVDETACTGKERIWSGWLTARRISRGPYRDGPARIWECDIWELNALFALMVFRASSAKRPIETDLARVTFAQASAPMAYTPVQDNGRFNTTDNPTNFDEADYVTRFPVELFATTAGISGKNVYAYYDFTEEEPSIHYDLVGVGPSSSLAISNDMADVIASPSDTFYPFLDGQFERSPAWKVTGMLLGYKGNYAYGERQATIDELGATEFSPTGMRRDEVYTTDRVGKLATAQSLIARMLEERAIDRDTVKTSIRVPAVVVNEIMPGDLIDAKYLHLPGWEAGQTVPVIRRNVVPTPGRTDLYDLHLELSSAARPAQPGGGPGTTFPPQPVGCDVDDITLLDSGFANLSVTTHQFTVSAPAMVEGALIVLEVGQRVPQADQDADVDDFIEATAAPVESADQDFTYRKWYRLAPASWDGVVQFTVTGDNNEIRVLWSAWTGVDTFHSIGIDDTTANNPATITCGSVTPPNGAVVLLVGGSVAGLNVTDPFSGAPIGDAVELEDEDGGSRVPMWSGYRTMVADGSAESVDYTPTWTGILAGTIGSVAAFICSGSDPDAPTCPAAGQWTQWAFLQEGDGSTSQFTIPCPYANGGLEVRVDGHPIVTGLTETTPEDGVFDLDFAPKAAQGDAPAERITYRFQGR